jgi:citrate synthase
VVVRVTASTGASPYHAVTSGLACLGLPLHAGKTERVANLFDAIAHPRAAERIITARLRRGEDLPGFESGLYQDMDPRARALLSAVRKRVPNHPALSLAEAVISSVERLTRRRPNYFFAIVCACRAAQLPSDAPLALIAIARSAGWIAHIIEQYTATKLTRPRARYVGILPTR